MSRHEVSSTSLIDRAKEHGTKFVAGTLIAIGAIGLAGCANNAEAKPGPETTISAAPSESATPSPTPTETAPSKADLEAKIEALEIPAGLEPQQLGEAFIDLKNKWWNAGTEDPEALNKGLGDSLAKGMSLDEFVADVAKNNTAIYAPAMFGPDWESNPEARTAVDNMVKANESVLSNFMGTAYSHSGAIGYKAWSELTQASADASTTGSRILQVNWINKDNNKEATGGETLTSPGGSVIVDWKVSDGKEFVNYIH